ncbi:hypothetical protein V865_005950 [Kwoniella europaea PYCC6329]|uniref:DUF5745 domain-containing protein n=1 Tax=Kwoniella europaea PYCC6329 TaxID=1423913 RepID=A0AAX4KPE2_9TREE
MPSDTLQLLQNLLLSLNIPINPPSLSSIPPTLILLTLESILQQKLDIPEELRRCNKVEDEIGLIKCLLGILADDLLNIDLSLIDPLKVLQGREREMEVVVMAVIVVAKRNGIVVTTSRGRRIGDGSRSMKSANEDYISFTYDNGYDNDRSGLPEPLKPDRSFSSPIDTPQDVFVVPPQGNDRGDMYSDSQEMLYAKENHDDTNYNDNDISKISNEFDPYLTPVHDTFPRDISQEGGNHADHEGILNDRRERDVPLKQSYSSTTSASSSISGKTVLQYMIEEFGLEPG